MTYTPRIQRFGQAPDGSAVDLVEIRNGGTTARIMTWGASLQDLRLDGIAHSLVLGSTDFAAYLAPMRYFGAIVGPVANRIADGRMTLAGQVHHLERNERGITTLHGGSQGFGCRNWQLARHDATGCTLRLHHPAGLCGFPGNIEVEASYEIEESGALRIEIAGRTDAPTFFGPAFHGYWNLDGTADLSGHRLTVHAETYLPVDERLIPLPAPAPVGGTGFDFRSPRCPDGHLDHNFCLAPTRATQPRPACRLEAGGLCLEIETTEVGLQVYDAGRLDTRPAAGHSGQPYGRNAGVAIEPQFWPDSPNHPGFPQNLLLPGQDYRQVSRFAARPARR